MRKSQPLGFECRVLQEDGSSVLLSDLSPEELKELEKNLVRRLESWAAVYFSAHPEEFDLIPDRKTYLKE